MIASSTIGERRPPFICNWMRWARSIMFCSKAILEETEILSRFFKDLSQNWIYLCHTNIQPWQFSEKMILVPSPSGTSVPARVEGEDEGVWSRSYNVYIPSPQPSPWGRGGYTRYIRKRRPIDFVQHTNFEIGSNKIPHHSVVYQHMKMYPKLDTFVMFSWCNRSW